MSVTVRLVASITFTSERNEYLVLVTLCFRATRTSTTQSLFRRWHLARQLSALLSTCSTTGDEDANHRSHLPWLLPGVEGGRHFTLPLAQGRQARAFGREEGLTVVVALEVCSSMAEVAVRRTW